MNKFKKALSLLLCGAVVLSLGVGCSKEKAETPVNQKEATTSNKQAASEEAIKITFLNSKGEIQEQLEKMAKMFNEDNPSVTVEIIPCGAGQSPTEMLTTLYASNNAPAIAMLDPADIATFKEKIGDLSGEKWVNDAMPGSLDALKVDEKLVGFPFAVEGWGLIYNRAVLSEAGVEIADINTRDALEDAFKKIEEKGKNGVVIASADWSLGAHLFTTAYSSQSDSTAEIKKFLDELASGSDEIKDNAVVNGLLDTFDIMKQYNIAKADPLTSVYETNPEIIGSGKVGFWFMGNWAWPQIKEFAGDNNEFGFIPVPISNNEGDYGNTHMPAATTKVLVVDASENTAEQQAAAKAFLNWIVYEEKGQKGLVEECSIIPAFTNISAVLNDPLGKSIQSYIKEGKTSNGVMLSNKHWGDIGAAMQKYLGDYASRDELFAEITTYWRSGDYK
ncbi:ABC transporter substrate-binding protein [Cellulosilyticum sp. I15G10I2]|uniref:ABC transporter substrate-binding protein n=1 Tax=Cellulosilyticum sp. I15G10I2 TaxID=1892843 RepID=UPI00085C928E|nr:ABC transporter substrate-binding protein [Cellulosilyticum sp. I15G10I2]